MLTLIVILNVLIILLAWKRRQFSRLLFFVLFFPVITAQIIYIEIVNYDYVVPWHTFDFSLLNIAEFYVLASLVVVFILGVFSQRKIKINYSKHREYYPDFYSNCFFLFNIMFSSMFIFIFIGYSDALELSRPGVKSGSIIFLVFMISLIYPALVNLRNNLKIKHVDVLNISLAIIVCLVMSKMHAIAITLTALVIYLNRESGNFNKNLMLVGLVLTFLLFSFVSLQYFKDVAESKAERDVIIFTLQLIYLYGNEAFSGLFSSVSTFYGSPETTGLTFGISQILDGIMKTIPSIIRPDFAFDVFYFDPGYNERQSIVASIYEETFRAFGMFGAIIYGAVLHFVLRFIDNQLKREGRMMLSIILLLLLPFLLRGPVILLVNQFIFLGGLIFLYQHFQSTRNRPV